MWSHISVAIGIFIIGETLANLIVFQPLKKHFCRSAPDAPNNSRILGIQESSFKGILERFVLFIALHYGFTQILVVFGALKLGTRITDEKKEHITNNYFLIGNFLSILVALAYTVGYLKLVALIDAH